MKSSVPPYVCGGTGMNGGEMMAARMVAVCEAPHGVGRARSQTCGIGGPQVPAGAESRRAGSPLRRCSVSQRYAPDGVAGQLPEICFMELTSNSGRLTASRPRALSVGVVEAPVALLASVDSASMRPVTSTRLPIAARSCSSAIFSSLYIAPLLTVAVPAVPVVPEVPVVDPAL